MSNDCFVAQILEDNFCISAEGKTFEEARKNLLEKISEMVEVEIVRYGVRFPTTDSEEVPAYLPHGCCVVKFSLHDHHCGNTYKTEYLAVPIGTKLTTPYGEELVINKGTNVTLLDDLSSFVIPLPKSSYMLRKGGWLPVTEIAWLTNEQLLTGRNPI